ncbi:hypothetical protein [Flavobacterium sp.]|jgi:hypothetical protein|uniref:hypothetical protein n=1 Tax=Flavobacterium sp. TaxID=239 RepID=UPI0037BE2650
MEFKKDYYYEFHHEESGEFYYLRFIERQLDKNLFYDLKNKKEIKINFINTKELKLFIKMKELQLFFQIDSLKDNIDNFLSDYKLKIYSVEGANYKFLLHPNNLDFLPEDSEKYCFEGNNVNKFFNKIENIIGKKIDVTKKDALFV